MKHLDKLKYKIIPAILMAAFFIMALPIQTQAADNGDAGSKKVIVGYYQSNNFQEGTSDSEPKSGYSYDYLQTVADYSGWEYEYVYGSWAEVYDEFIAGNIDIMAGVCYTEERAQYMLFPEHEMGNEKYYLYKRQDDTSITSDLSTFTGKKIGGIKNNLLSISAEKWIEENDVDAELVEFDDFESRDKAFYSGEIDCVSATDNNVSPEDGMTPVVKIGENPYYLAVANGREDLLEELNKAIETINVIDGYFLERLQLTWFGNTALGVQLTEEEEEFVENTDNLTVGYLNYYLPYCSADKNGNVTGLVTDVLNAIFKGLNIEGEISLYYTPYTAYEDMVEALRTGNIDIAFPVGGSSWYIEKDGINKSSPVVSTGMSLVFKGEYTDDVEKTIAVNKNNRMQYYYVKEVFPDADVVFFDSIEECLDAVIDGKTGSTTLNGLRASSILKNGRYNSLSNQILSKQEKRYFGVATSNTTLLLLLNRGLQVIGTDYGLNAAYHYTDGLYSYTFMDFLGDNIWIIIITAVIVLCVIIAFAIYRVRRAKKETEKEHIQQEKLNGLLQAAETANHAKTSFLFNMSHDIRTPMNAIVGFTEILERHQDDPQKRGEYLQKIRAASTTLLDLIDNVLEMARIESGVQTVEEKAWSVEQFRDTTFSVFDIQMAEKNIEYTYDIDVEHRCVYCDVTKLREIFINLLSNAYKYTESGGSVSLSLKELPSDEPGYAKYRTTVTDTGIGMSRDFQEHIFEQFSRERTTTESHIQGSGLGLAIVKKYTDLMNGQVEVNSVKGKGTTFTITLSHPIADCAEISVESAAVPDSCSFSGKRILLAEDNELNTEIATIILTEAGFEVEHASNGQICVDMLTEKESGYYDIILMDIQMPVMNGYEATQAIRALPDKEKARTIIIALTANAFEEDRQNALAADMDGFVAKPIVINELLTALSDASR